MTLTEEPVRVFTGSAGSVVRLLDRPLPEIATISRTRALARTWLEPLRLANHFFLTSKPYSYASEMLCAVVFGIFLTGRADGRVPAWMALALFMWLSFNWISDFIQRDRGRIRPPVWLWAAPLVMALSLAASSGGVYGALASSPTRRPWPSTRKAIIPSWGPFGPLFAGSPCSDSSS